MSSKNDREPNRFASDWFGDAFAGEDDDAIEIRPRRQRRSVTSSRSDDAVSPSVGRAFSGGERTPSASAARLAPSAKTASTETTAKAAQPESSASALRPATSASAARPATSAKAASTETSAKAAQPESSASSLRPATRAKAANTETSAKAAQPESSASALRPATSASERTIASQTGAARPQSGQARSASGAGERKQSVDSEKRAENVRPIVSRSEKRGDGTTVTAQSRAPRTHSKRRRKRGKLTVGCVIRRTLLVIFTAIFFAAGVILAIANTLGNGPSETARNMAVMSAMHSSAAKWAPYLFLPPETIEQIIADSNVVVTDETPIADIVGGDENTAVISEDRWENAIDGMIYETVNGKTFKGYVLLIKDPSRVSVAISTEDFSYASRIFEIADQYGAIAAINGGEFPDNGVQTGANPIGLTYWQGKCVRDVEQGRTFIGFTNDNKLYVEEGTTRAQADAAGIRDGVAFQTGNTLITNDGENVTYYYADSNTGVAQRTGIGQLADGTVMFLVTDGRTASSMGATKNDVINTFVEYGAVTAGLLDGGSSAMLYYRDWYDKYNVDRDQLDEWQLMGLVNRYKAFTNPRAIPTFFIVK